MQRRARQRPAVHLTALVDVLFILVVFVMLAARFDGVGALEVSLPGASADEPAPASAIVLVMPAAGPATLDGTVLDEGGDVAAQLEAARAGRPDVEGLSIMADRAVPLGRVTAILDAAARAGFTTTSLATSAHAEGAP